MTETPPSETWWLSAFRPDDPEVTMPFVQTMVQWMDAVDAPFRTSIADYENVQLAKESLLLSEHLEQLAWQKPSQWDWIPHQGPAPDWSDVQCLHIRTDGCYCVSVNKLYKYEGYLRLRGTDWKLCNCCFDKMTKSDASELLKQSTYLNCIA